MKVIVDGEVVARLRPGQCVEFDGTGELQELAAKMDWVTSRSVEVVDGPNKQIVVEFGFPTTGPVTAGDPFNIEATVRSDRQVEPGQPPQDS